MSLPFPLSVNTTLSFRYRSPTTPLQEYISSMETLRRGSDWCKLVCNKEGENEIWILWVRNIKNSLLIIAQCSIHQPLSPLRHSTSGNDSKQQGWRQQEASGPAAPGTTHRNPIQTFRPDGKSKKKKELGRDCSLLRLKPLHLPSHKTLKAVLKEEHRPVKSWEF